MENLLPCPCCGARAEMFMDPERGAPWVRCSFFLCGLRQTPRPGEAPADAAERWNKRVPSSMQKPRHTVTYEMEDGTRSKESLSTADHASKFASAVYMCRGVLRVWVDGELTCGPVEELVNAALRPDSA